MAKRSLLMLHHSRRHGSKWCPGMVMLFLLALALQIALPIAHNTLEYRAASSDLDSQLLARGPSASGRATMADRHSEGRHHDPESCPICQAASLSHSFCIVKVATGPTTAVSGEIFFPDYTRPVPSTLFSFDFSPRSPPRFS